VIVPAPRDVWQDVIASDSQALVFQTPAWVDCICASGGYEDASCLYETRAGRRLILPMVRRSGVPRWLTTQASFFPGWGMGGLLADDPVRREDVALVFDDLLRRQVLRTTVRPNPLSAEVWAAARPAGVLSVPRLAHVLDLEGGFATVWSERFTGTARTAVRKAGRAEIVVECDATGRLVPVFHDLLRMSLDRWARQQHEPLALARLRGRRRDPLVKFRAMATLLGESCRIWVAWVEGRAAAAILVLQDKNASYTRGAMDKQLAGPSRANYLLHQLAIEQACEAGCRSYHMGESGTSPSLAQFKTRFGAAPHRYAEYHVERLPLTRADQQLRKLVKRAVRFSDHG